MAQQLIPDDIGRRMMEGIVENDLDAVRLVLNETVLDLNLPLPALEIDDEPIPALHLACLYGRLEIVEFLVEAGASVDHRSRDGRTPLYCALSPTALLPRRSQSELILMVQALRNKCLDWAQYVNMSGPLGKAALHLAVTMDAGDVVEWLLINGARATKIDSVREETSWEICCSEQYHSAASAFALLEFDYEKLDNNNVEVQTVEVLSNLFNGSWTYLMFANVRSIDLLQRDL